MPANEAKIADIVIGKLAVHIGPNVAKMALRTFAKKTGASSADALTAADLPALIQEMRPILNVMIGRMPADAVLTDITRACHAGVP